MVIGTASYLSPEQVRGQPVGPASDVYALGLVLLEALTGEPAFTGTMQEVVTARVTRELEIPSSVAPAWASLLTSMTRRDPGLRPSAAEVLDALRAIGGSTDPGATTVAAGAPTAVLTGASGTARMAPAAVRPRRDVRPLVVAAAVIAGVVLIALVANARDAGEPPAAPAATTSTTSTTAGATVPPPSPEDAEDSRAALCADLEEREEALDREKKVIEETYRDDKATRELLKAQLEADKKELERQKRAAGC
jgi:hypothetical protein